MEIAVIKMQVFKIQRTDESHNFVVIPNKDKSAVTIQRVTQEILEYMEDYPEIYVVGYLAPDCSLQIVNKATTYQNW